MMLSVAGGGFACARNLVAHAHQIPRRVLLFFFYCCLLFSLSE